MNKIIAFCFSMLVLILCASCTLEINGPDTSPEPTVPVEILPVSRTTGTPVPTVTPSPTPNISPTAAENTPSPTPEPTVVPSKTPEPTKQPSVNGIDVNIVLPLPETPNDPYASSYGNPLDGNRLSNKKIGWYFGINDNFQPPTAQSEFDIREFNGYYLGDISQKVLYLTFDEGYENGFTPSILDTLRDKDVKAAFFVTKPFVQSNLDLVMRMIDEGHLVCAHSVTHKSSPDLSDEEMEYELTGLAEYYKSVTGQDIAPYFRPPMGEYSARTLEITDRLGYKSIFWSFAYADWDVNKQPGIEKAFNTTVSHMHNGAIILLHAVSESNTQALPYIIDALKNNGFEFKTLDDLPEVKFSPDILETAD